MKIQHKAILLALLAGAFFWVLDAAFCFLFLHGGTFLDLLVLKVSSEHLFVRLLAIGVAIIFAIVGLSLEAGRKRAEELLRKSQERYKTLFESSPNGILIADIQTKEFKYANPAICAMLGYSRKELTTLAVDDIHPQEEMEQVVRKFRARGPEEKALTEDVACLRKDGTVIYVDINTKTETIDSQEYNIAFFRDVTDRKRAEEALRRERDYAGSIIETAHAIILVLDVQGQIVSFNPYMEKLSGYRLEEVKGKDWFSTFLPERDGERIRSVFQNAVQDIQTHGNVNPIVSRDGRDIQIEWYDKTLKDANGNVNGVLSIGQDITDRKQAEERLRDYQEQLRGLASELALAEDRLRRNIGTDLHDGIGQGLALVKMQLDALRSEGDSGRNTAETLGQITKSVEKMVQQVRTLIFDLSPPVLYELGLEPAVEWLIDSTRSSHGMEVSFEDDGQDKPLDDDLRTGLFRAVRELLVNAAKHAQAKSVKVHTRKEGPNIKVQVEDDGVGFDVSQVISRKGVKAGFGLVSIRERLRCFGGSFELDSEPGKGMRATLVAPLKTVS